MFPAQKQAFLKDRLGRSWPTWECDTYDSVAYFQSSQQGTRWVTSNIAGNWNEYSFRDKSWWARMFKNSSKTRPATLALLGLLWQTSRRRNGSTNTTDGASRGQTHWKPLHRTFHKSSQIITKGILLRFLSYVSFILLNIAEYILTTFVGTCSSTMRRMKNSIAPKARRISAKKTNWKSTSSRIRRKKVSRARTSAVRRLINVSKLATSTSGRSARCVLFPLR